MPWKEPIEVHSPEPEQVGEPVEAHIVKKYGKFHGHVKMSDGAEHHMPPHATMHEAHAAIAPHVGAPEPESMPQDAENEPGQQEEIQA
jgi:hypothetical protein